MISPNRTASPVSKISTTLASRSLLLLLLASAALTAGCSSELAKGDVEKLVSKQLAAQIGRDPGPIVCPGNLKGKVGEKMTCKLNDKVMGAHDVHVSIASIEGSTAQLNVAIEESAPSGSAEPHPSSH